MTFAFALPAQAEQLQFDHRLSPALREVLDSGDKSRIAFNASNPARLVDLIVIKGKSVKSWTEAFEIVAIVRPRDVGSAADWMAVNQKLAKARCPSATFTVIAQDDVSVTYERRSPGCRAELAGIGLYRLITGKRSWFQLAVLDTAEPDAQSREEWLALLASARLD